MQWTRCGRVAMRCPMRLALLLSALLTALIGSMSGTGPVSAQSYQSVASAQVAMPRVEQPIARSRPAVPAVRLVDVLARSDRSAELAPAPIMPRYAGRLRV